MPEFLAGYDDQCFDVITPDKIYDYFEPLFRKEVYTSEIHQTYLLTTAILPKLQPESLESKIIKTLSLIYILEQFEKLKPTKDEIVGIFSINYTVEEIEDAIANLIEKEYVVYLKRSNDYLRLKQTSGVDIGQKIRDSVAALAGKVSTKATLNASNFDNYIYPSRYNDEREMTRYFSFEFIDEDEVRLDVDWTMKSEAIDADGVVYGVIPQSDESISRLREELIQSSSGHQRFLFILPKKYKEITEIIQEFNAVSLLREQSSGDKILFDEYEVVYEDLREVISDFISTYTHPESFKSVYIYMGEERPVTRKAALTGLLSDICDDVYSLTPVVNNEAINRNDITAIASNSRNKIIAGLLRNELEHNLGLSGSGQEVSIMRSTLLRTGVLVTDNLLVRIELKPDDELIRNMLTTIVGFIQETKAAGSMSFGVLYRRLVAPENHIGLRKGLIPIYLAAVFHEFKQELILQDRFGQVPITADVLLQVNANPEGFTLAYLDWDPEKAEFVQRLAEIFSDYVIEQLFTDGTEKCLGLFKTATNDEEALIARLAKTATDLRLEDWDSSTYERFVANVKKYKATAEAYQSIDDAQEEVAADAYQVTFVGENGQSVTKRFSRVDYSKRGKLLYNQVTDALDSMGQSIPEQEKRQIIMDILKELC